MKNLKVYLLIIGVVVGTSKLVAQAIDPTTDATLPASGKFRGNPFEAAERVEREREYQEFFEYDLEVDPEVEKNVFFQEIFAPRIHDETFDTDLANTHNKGRISLRLSPKFGDFFDDDFIRSFTGIKYNFSNYFEAFFDAGSYFPSPFGDEDDYGFYSLRFGGKYSWVRINDTTWNLAVGVNAETPVSTPPNVISDGYARYEPYFSLSHQIPAHPDWLGYLNATVQIVDNSPFKSSPVDPQPRDQLFLRPGVIYYPGGRFRYSFELEYRTNMFDFREVAGSRPPGPIPEGIREENFVLAYEEVHEVLAAPGVTWFPNREIRENLFIPGNWDLGLRLQIPLIEETGEDIGVSLKFRWFYDHRNLILKDLGEFVDRLRD